MGVDELGHRFRIGLVAIIGENFVLDEIGDVGAIGEGVASRLVDPLARRAKHDAGEFDAEAVGELAASAEQFERDRVHDAALDLDENPDVLVAAEMLGQFLLHRGPAGRRRGDGGLVVHGGLLRILRPI